MSQIFFNDISKSLHVSPLAGVTQTPGTSHHDLSAHPKLWGDINESVCQRTCRVKFNLLLCDVIHAPLRAWPDARPRLRNVTRSQLVRELEHRNAKRYRVSRVRLHEGWGKLCYYPDHPQSKHLPHQNTHTPPDPCQAKQTARTHQ